MADKHHSQPIMKPQSLHCADCGFITCYSNALQVHRLKEHAKGPDSDKPFKCGVSMILMPFCYCQALI